MTAGQIRWSASLVAEGDRAVTLEEVVELADAVAVDGGIASGIGTTTYGAQLLVTAGDATAAAALATATFSRAAATAGLPPWPISLVDLISEDDELADLGAVPEGDDGG